MRAIETFFNSSFCYLFDKNISKSFFTISSISVAMHSAFFLSKPIFLATFNISFKSGFIPLPLTVVACSPFIE